MCIFAKDVTQLSMPRFNLTLKITEKLKSVDAQLLKENNQQVAEVEITENNSSRRLCGMKWDKKDADVICKMKHFPGALAAIKRYKKDTTIKKWLVDLECHGNEKSIAECYQTENDRCEGGYTAGIMCRDPKITCK